MSVKRVRGRKHGRKRVQVGASDPSLTATSGVAAIAEFVDKLDAIGRFDRGIGSIKERARGVSAGELLVGLAQAQLLGGDALVALDRQRQDVAAAELSAVPGIASTTAGSLARRFDAEHLVGIEAATADLAGRAFGLLPVSRRTALCGRVTIDLDSTDVEVYGSRKQGVAYNYAGQRAGRPHLATRAEAGLTTAAELLAGNHDVRPRAADMLRRGLAGIPERVCTMAAANDRLRVRADAGYFTADLALAAVAEGCDFAVAAKRNTAMWRAYASIPRTGVGRRDRDAGRAGSRGRLRPDRLARGDLHDRASGPRRCRGDLGRPQIAAAAHHRPRPARVGDRGHRDPRLRGLLHRHQHPRQRRHR